MAFSLIEQSGGLVPITALTKERLSSWLKGASERGRNWARSIGFTADAGKLALMPGDNGRLERVLVGLGDGADAGATMWAFAGLPDALPEGSYRLDPAPEGADPTRLALGWALATYAFTRYHAKPASGAALAWPEGADRGRVERLARAIFLARDLANTPAGRSRPRRIGEGCDSGCRASGRLSSRHRRRRTPRRKLSDDPRSRPRQQPATATGRYRLGRPGSAEGDPWSARACALTPAASTSKPPPACG